MIRNYITNENLRRSLEGIHYNIDDFDDEGVDRFINELKHSLLIIAADIRPKSLGMMTAKLEGKSYGLLFTDMHEFRKAFHEDDVEAHVREFRKYRSLVKDGLVDGYIINPESEAFICRRELILAINGVPDFHYPSDDVYTPSELRQVRDSMDNRDLEEFISDSSNVGRYEELFEKMSASTLLTLMLSRDDLASFADDGVISLHETGPLGFLYIDEVGGEYATVYTSEDKIASIETGYNKYSQLVNFSRMATFIMHDDMDGIIINPNSDNILLTRDVLFEYSSLLERTCNNPKLNEAFYHMFIIEEAI